MVGVFVLLLPKILHTAGMHPEYNSLSFDLPGKRALAITTPVKWSAIGTRGYKYRDRLAPDRGAGFEQRYADLLRDELCQRGPRDQLTRQDEAASEVVRDFSWVGSDRVVWPVLCLSF